MRKTADRFPSREAATVGHTWAQNWQFVQAPISQKLSFYYSLRLAMLVKFPLLTEIHSVGVPQKCY